MADWPNRPRLSFSSNNQFGRSPPTNSIYPNLDPQKYKYQTAGPSSFQNFNKPLWQNNRFNLETGGAAVHKDEPARWNRRSEFPNWKNNACAKNDYENSKNSGNSQSWMPPGQRDNIQKVSVSQNWNNQKVNSMDRLNIGSFVWDSADRNRESQMLTERDERGSFSSVWSSQLQQFSKQPEQQLNRFTESQSPTWNRVIERPDWTKSSGAVGWNKDSASQDWSNNSNRSNYTWSSGSRDPFDRNPIYSEERQWNDKLRHIDRWTDVSRSPQNTPPPIVRELEENVRTNRPQKYEDWSRSNKKSPEPGLKFEQKINRPYSDSYNRPKEWSSGGQENEFMTDRSKRQYYWNDDAMGSSGFKRPRLEESFLETRNTVLPNIDKIRTGSEVHSSTNRLGTLVKSSHRRNPVSVTDLRRKLDKIDSTSLPSKAVAEYYRVAVCRSGKKRHFKEESMMEIEEKLVADLRKMAESENIDSQPELKFRSIKLATKFHMIIECEDAATAEWLLKWTPPRLNMKVKLPQDKNFMATISFSVKRPFDVKNRMLMRVLQAQNPGIDVSGWTMRQRIVTRKRINYFFTINGLSIRYLINHNWELLFCFEKFHVRQVFNKIFRRRR